MVRRGEELEAAGLNTGMKEREGIETEREKTEAGPKRDELGEEGQKVRARKGVGGRLIASCGVSGLS